MVQQCVLKIKRFMQKNGLELKDIIIATLELRGIPIAAQVAQQLHRPLRRRCKMNLYIRLSNLRRMR